MPLRLMLPFRGPLLAACLVVLLASMSSSATAQLRVVNYNIAQLLGDEAAMQDVVAELMVDDSHGFATPVSVFIFQEVRSMDVQPLGQILNAVAPPGVLYAQGAYTNFSKDGLAGAQAMFYRAGMLLEDTSQHMDIFTGAGRYSDRWRLRLLGYDSPLASFYVYGSHLRASQGSANQQERLAGVQALRSNADALPVGTHVIFGGDMNFYHNSEPGYLYFFTTGNGQAIDPLGTGPWAGPGNAIKHTQSPRKVMAGGLIGGGLDDRFDFQLSNQPFHTGQGLSYIPGTYRTFGNDGLHYSEAINLGNNFYYPGNVPLSNFIADALHDASDHLPVVVDYQIPARMNAAINPSSFGKVIQGAEQSIDYLVQNSAPYVNTPLGADVLVFSVTGTGGVGGQHFGEAYATEPFISGSLPVNTSQVGPISGAVTFASPSEAVQPAQIVRQVSGTVVRPSAPSFASEVLQSEREIVIEVEAESGVHDIYVPIYNFGFDSLQAKLNLQSIDGFVSPFSYQSGLVEDVGLVPAELILAFDSTGLPDGTYEASLAIHTSDEELPGASTSQLELTLAVLVGEAALCEADLNGDGVVDVADLLDLMAAWGPCPGSLDCDADLTGDRQVDVSDLLALLGDWGICR